MIRPIAAALLAFSTFTAFAQGAPADTLERIKATRTITLGVRPSARPFSYLDEAKKPVGYSVDLCMSIVDEIKREFKLPALEVRTVTLSGAERIPKLVSGEIDLECGSTTHTKAREAQVDFSYTIFVAAMRVLVPAGTKVESVKDLNGLPVALSKGTTSEKLFTQLAGSEVAMQITSFPDNNAAYQALKTGKVKAFPQDDSLLTGLAAADKATAELQLSTLALSVEPYAIMVRKGDAALLSVVDRTLAKLYGSGTIYTLYRRWFDTPTLQIPMGRLTRDGFLRPNKEAGVAMLLGYSI